MGIPPHSAEQAIISELGTYYSVNKLPELESLPYEQLGEESARRLTARLGSAVVEVPSLLNEMRNDRENPLLKEVELLSYMCRAGDEPSWRAFQRLCDAINGALQQGVVN